MNENINTDEVLIFKILNIEFKDEHPSVYVYVRGQERAQETAIRTATRYLATVLNGCSFDLLFLKKTMITFFEYKKEQYKKGEIKIKPLY